MVFGPRQDYTCKSCSKMFSSNSNLERHTQAVHEKIRNFKCGECAKEFYNRADLDRHTSAVHALQLDFHCPHCKKMFNSKHNLKRHAVLMHSKIDDNKPKWGNYNLNRQFIKIVGILISMKRMLSRLRLKFVRKSKLIVGWICKTFTLFCKQTNSGSAAANGRWRLVSAQVVSCSVYEKLKQKRQCIKGNYQICLTIGQIRAFISFY